LRVPVREDRPPLDADVPPHLLERQRTGKRLSYEIIELSEPRVIKGPSLAPVRCNNEAVTLSG